MYEGPEFRHLITFVTIAEECSFNKAAERLHITQPALSSHIRHLEEGLNKILFKRVPHGAELTQAGRDFLPYARHMLHMCTHAVKVTSRSHVDGDWPLRLGYSPFMNHKLMEEALKAYKEIVPDGPINSSGDCTAELIDMLHDGRLDAAIITLPVHQPNLSEHFVCEDNVLICLRGDDPAAAFVEVPKEVVAENLRIMFNRAYHPELYDRIQDAIPWLSGALFGAGVLDWGAGWIGFSQEYLDASSPAASRYASIWRRPAIKDRRPRKLQRIRAVTGNRFILPSRYWLPTGRSPPSLATRRTL